jgi:exonuclease III
MSDKPLTLVSLNVRGLKGGKDKPKKIKAWMASLQTPPQISLIQEHHIGKDDDPRFARGMEFWRGTSFWNEGIPLGRSQKTMAGTAILIDRATTPLIKEHGILVEGRVQFVTLLSPDNELLTIINVYAPQTSTGRALLWNSITQADLASDRVILGGNLNHTENTNLTSTLGSRRMNRREAAAWHRMTLKYSLADAWLLDRFHKQTEKEYTFNNGRSGSSSAISRIDKFLISQAIEERGGRIEAGVSMKKLSDHSPLCIKIWGNLDSAKSTSGYFDASLLNDESKKKEILQAWIGEDPLPTSDQGWAPWLEAATDRATQCNRRLSKEKKRTQGAQIRSCTKKIQLAEV